MDIRPHWVRFRDHSYIFLVWKCSTQNISVFPGSVMRDITNIEGYSFEFEYYMNGKSIYTFNDIYICMCVYVCVYNVHRQLYQIRYIYLYRHIPLVA